MNLQAAENDAEGFCIHCGRDNNAHEGEPCSDDCPLYDPKTYTVRSDDINSPEVNIQAVNYEDAATQFALAHGSGQITVEGAAYYVVFEVEQLPGDRFAISEIDREAK